MKHATMDDFKEVCEIFKQYKHYFPHIRQDYIQRMIEAERCIYQDGVVITYNIYQVTQYQGKSDIGKVIKARRGDWLLKQIAIDTQGSGNAKKVVQEFFDTAYPNPIWLSVRADNLRAKRFYEKMGMEYMGETSWSGGELLGSVYRKNQIIGDEIWKASLKD